MNWIFLGLEYPAARLIYTEINPKSEKWCRLTNRIFTKLFLPTMIVPQVVYCFTVYFVTDLGNDAFEMLYPLWWASLALIHYIDASFSFSFHPFQNCRFPFDWKNPIGYLIACTLQFILLIYLFHAAAFCVSIEIASYLLLISLTKDIKNTVYDMNSSQSDTKLRSTFLKQICEFVQFHANAKRLTIVMLILI